ncbi:mercuric transport protein MerTP [Rufibacter quisquiliarum]|uniref:Mercuric transport protein MerT n=1 Tax=Rufibacter quisquiliarum TaxID=1549639 RepID=A0A839GWG7_9BACT|nr:mercuric transport protein MerTP [Rufibacter quisquiliarum]MBA9079086.1 copper chaperone CopZ [Rufibacter quisquiliarum]
MKNDTLNSPKKSTSNSIVGAGVLAALAASLCCITPVLALLGGISGIAATFSWLEPFRPYLVGASVLVLGFAWYQKLKPQPTAQMDCACEKDEKPSFLQSKAFLGTVTALAVILLSFPYYSGAFFPKVSPATALTSPATTTVHANIYVAGMTCSGCEHSVNNALRQTPGVIAASSSYSTGMAQVTYDKSKVDLPKLAQKVTAETGYKVTRFEEVNQK